MKEEYVLLCQRVGKLSCPVEGAIVGNCANCDAPIWISPSSDELMATHEAIPHCSQCVKAKAGEDNEVIELTDLQVAELQKAGLSKEDIKYVQDKLKDWIIPKEDKCEVCGAHIGWILDPIGETVALGLCDKHWKKGQHGTRAKTKKKKGSPKK